MTSEPASARRRGFPWLVVVAVLVAALSLRAPVLATTPVIRSIERDLGLDSVESSLLVTSAVLMFAVVTPIAALVIRRAGPELALLTCLSGVVAGVLIRGASTYGTMLAGTIVIGAFITIGNVVVPVIIRRDVPPRHVSTITAAYAATMNAGSLVATLTMVPVAAAIGWPLALLGWGLVAVAGIALWIVHLRRDRVGDGTWAERYSGAASMREQGAAEAIAMTGPVPVVNGRAGVLRMPIIWMLMGAFASQSLVYYGLSTWLPAMVADLNGVGAATAGAQASVFQGGAIVGAFVVPLLLRRFPIIVPAVVVGVGLVSVSAGMLLAPQLVVVWGFLGAIGHAGGFVVTITILMRVVRTDAEAATGSALVQGAAFVFSGFGAPIVGGLFEVTHDWTAGLLFTLAVGVVFLALQVASVVTAQRR